MKPQHRIVAATETDEQHVELGWLLKGLVLAGSVGALGAIIGVPLLAHRVSNAEGDVGVVEEKIARTERNLAELDVNQRILRQESTWNGTKLDKLLDAANVARVPRPPLPESSLEPPPALSAPD